MGRRRINLDKFPQKKPQECGKFFAIVHRGRTCHNWNMTLSNSTVGVRECRDLAAAGGYKGFVHTNVVPDTGGSKGDVILSASKPADKSTKSCTSKKGTGHELTPQAHI